MTNNELFKLKSRLAAIHGRAESVEAEVCEVLNELAAEHIPTTPELTEEATSQLKDHVFYTLSSAIDALMDIIAEIGGTSLPCVGCPDVKPDGTCCDMSGVCEDCGNWECQKAGAAL